MYQGSGWGGVYPLVEVMACSAGEIELGRGFDPLAQWHLVTAWSLELQVRGCRGRVCVGIDMWVAVVGDWDAEIGWGWVF
jgi:fermentation-respiration switch protein FrsA (DUF1100 family)